MMHPEDEHYPEDGAKIREGCAMLILFSLLAWSIIIGTIWILVR